MTCILEVITVMCIIIQWNLDIINLYITIEVLGITNDFRYPSSSKLYGKKPRYDEHILSVRWLIVISRFHCNHEKI